MTDTEKPAHTPADWKAVLKRAMARWEVGFGKEGLDSFQTYLDELLHWNDKLNLTALREPQHIALGHFADSLAPMCLDSIFRAKHAKAIDIGTGAGFPGLPLKIVNPSWAMTLVESTGKKCDFLKAVVGAMELNHVDIQNHRCEELGQDKDHREKYDFAFARALSGLSTLVEYALPFLKVGGQFIAHRGRTAAEEVGRIHVALEELGGEVGEVRHYDLPELGGSRALVIIHKVKPTSKHYPRRIGVAAKRPL